MTVESILNKDINDDLCQEKNSLKQNEEKTITRSLKIQDENKTLSDSHQSVEKTTTTHSTQSSTIQASPDDTMRLNEKTEYEKLHQGNPSSQYFQKEKTTTNQASSDETMTIVNVDINDNPCQEYEMSHQQKGKTIARPSTKQAPSYETMDILKENPHQENEQKGTTIASTIQAPLEETTSLLNDSDRLQMQTCFVMLTRSDFDVCSKYLMMKVDDEDKEEKEILREFNNDKEENQRLDTSMVENPGCRLKRNDLKNVQKNCSPKKNHLEKNLRRSNIGGIFSIFFLQC